MKQSLANATHHIPKNDKMLKKVHTEDSYLFVNLSDTTDTSKTIHDIHLAGIIASDSKTFTKTAMTLIFFIEKYQVGNKIRHKDHRDFHDHMQCLFFDCFDSSIGLITFQISPMSFLTTLMLQTRYMLFV